MNAPHVGPALSVPPSRPLKNTFIELAEEKRIQIARASTGKRIQRVPYGVSHQGACVLEHLIVENRERAAETLKQPLNPKRNP
jgi:hypothetical protein